MMFLKRWHVMLLITFSTLIAQDKYVNVLGKEILTAWNKFD